MENTGPVLLDVLGSERSISLFTKLIHELQDIEDRLANPKTKSTLLVPLNSAIESRRLRTWERQSDYDTFGPDVYKGEEGRARATENNRQFILSHMVDGFPLQVGTMITTMAGHHIFWEDTAGSKRIHPDGIDIVPLARRATNGEAWLISGIISPGEAGAQ